MYNAMSCGLTFDSRLSERPRIFLASPADAKYLNRDPTEVMQHFLGRFSTYPYQLVLHEPASSSQGNQSLE